MVNLLWSVLVEHNLTSILIITLYNCSIYQLSQLIVNAGGIAAVIDYIGDTRGNVRLPGIMMLGYVGAHSENLAMAVIVSKVTTPFLDYHIRLC